MEVKFRPPPIVTLAVMAWMLIAEFDGTAPLTVAVAIPRAVALVNTGDVDVAELVCVGDEEL